MIVPRSETGALEAIHDALPLSVVRILDAYPAAFIAGGFVRDAIVGHSYKDIDIFGLTPSDAISIAIAYPSEWYETQGAMSITTPIYLDTTGEMCCGEARVVQLVHRFGCATPKEILDTFDITCCQNAYHAGKLIALHPDTLAREVRLVGNPNPTTYLRMLRLSSKGWRPSAHEVTLAHAVWEEAGAPTRMHS